MIQIQLSAVSIQRLAITLEGQACSIEARQNGRHLYLSLWKNDEMILGQRVCRDRSLMLTGARYRGFSGDLMWIDGQGFDDPQWTGLGSRWTLVYITPAEFP